MKKKSAPKKKRDFLWSIFFLSFSMLVNGSFAYSAYHNNLTVFWPLAGTVFSAIALILVGIERRKGELGKGRFLWSIFFAALTLGINIYIVSIFMTLWPILAFASTTLALSLLIREKYIK